MSEMIGGGWDERLTRVTNTRYWRMFEDWLNREYERVTIYPPKNQIYEALKHTPFEKVKVVIIGQDPYINEGQAHGMAFSVNPGVKVPPSLQNIYRELKGDIGCFIPNNGYLVPWADQGVLLLNTILTVEKGKSCSHKGRCWEIFTDEIIFQLNKHRTNIVFMLWGRNAQMKERLIDHDKHLVLKAAHPSPLAGGAFFGCRHFSKCNEFLYEVYPETIDWQIPNITLEKMGGA